MPTAVTKAHFDGAIATIRGDIQDAVAHFNASQQAQNAEFGERFTSVEKRLATMDVKMDAVMEILVTRKELHNLVRAIKAKGIALEESEIFSA